MKRRHRTDDFASLEQANRVYLGMVLSGGRMRLLSKVLTPVRERVVRRYAEQALAFDQEVAASGLKAATASWLALFTRELVVHGAENVPARGPVVFAANHPGSYDMEAALAAIPREDVMTMVADVPYYRILKNYARGRFIYVSDEPAVRREAAAASALHVKSGGALFINPAGNIEPEPGFEPRPQARLGEWHRSLDLLSRWAPDLRVVPTAITGILHPAANHALLKRALQIRSVKERERLAVAIRLFLPRLRTDRVTVRFGAPLSPTEGSPGLTERVRADLSRLLAGGAA